MADARNFYDVFDVNEAHERAYGVGGEVYRCDEDFNLVLDEGEVAPITPGGVWSVRRGSGAVWAFLDGAYYIVSRLPEGGFQVRHGPTLDTDEWEELKKTFILVPPDSA